MIFKLISFVHNYDIFLLLSLISPYFPNNKSDEHHALCVSFGGGGRGREREREREREGERGSYQGSAELPGAEGSASYPVPGAEERKRERERAVK
jgi:hypothetical protein